MRPACVVVRIGPQDCAVSLHTGSEYPGLHRVPQCGADHERGTSFDKKITVPLPDIRGREQILKHHLRNTKIETGMQSLHVQVES